MVQVSGKEVWIKIEGIANKVSWIQQVCMNGWMNWNMQYIHISVDSKRLNLKISILLSQTWDQEIAQVVVASCMEII